MSDDKITKDIAIPLGKTEDGNLRLLRVQGTDEKPTRVMMGVLHPLEDGKPIMSEVIKLSPCEGHNHLNVETVLEDPYKAQKEQARAASPEARLSIPSSSKTFSIPSPQYQANWDQVFGPGKKSKFSERN